MKSVSTTMTHLAERIRDILDLDPRITEKTMFGGLTLNVHVPVKRQEKLSVMVPPSARVVAAGSWATKPWLLLVAVSFSAFPALRPPVTVSLTTLRVVPAPVMEYQGASRGSAPSVRTPSVKGSLKTWAPWTSQGA